MITIQERYSELVSLAQLFLLREYPLHQAKTVDPTAHVFFQKWTTAPTAYPPVQKERSTAFTPSALPTRPTPSAPIRATTYPPTPDPIPTVPSPDPVPPDRLPPQLPPSPSPDPQPPVIREKASAAKQEAKSLILEPLSAPTAKFDKQGFWQLFHTTFPQVTLCDTIPSDARAQKLKNAWKNESLIPPVVLLSFHEEEKQNRFLKNLAQAISLRLAPARVLSVAALEKEKKWDTLLHSSQLRLVIACDYALYSQPGLMTYYREEPQLGKHFLHRTPLLLLSDLSLYLKQPPLKSLLWRAICNEFAASTRS